MSQSLRLFQPDSCAEDVLEQVAFGGDGAFFQQQIAAGRHRDDQFVALTLEMDVGRPTSMASGQGVGHAQQRGQLAHHDARFPGSAA